MSLLQSAVWDFLFYRPSRNWLLDPELQTEEIVLNTTDNKQLVCLFVRSQSPIKRGAIFLIHGRGGNAAKYAKYAKPLIQEGFDVFIAGLRGFGKSGGRPNHRNVVNDSLVALEQFLSLDEVKGGKKILWGLSLGGQVAIHLAAKLPGAFDALVVEGAVASFEDAVKDYYPGRTGQFFRWFISSPYTAAHDIRELKNLPKLIIHSREDDRISAKNAETLFANAQEPKFQLTIEGSHLYGLNKQNSVAYIDAFKKVVEFGNNGKERAVRSRSLTTI